MVGDSPRFIPERAIRLQITGHPAYAGCLLAFQAHRGICDILCKIKRLPVGY